MTTERKGEFFTIAGGAIWAFFPIITILAQSKIPSILALAYATLFSCVFFFILFIIKRGWSDLKNILVWKYSLMVALFIGVLFYGFYFWGLQSTTAGNAGLIALFETFTAFAFFTLIRKESFKASYRIGSLLMIIGAGIVLFRNFNGVQMGDILIVIATCFAPIGNLYQQKLKKIAKTETILFIRTLIATPFLFMLAKVFGATAGHTEIVSMLPFLVINGFLIFGISKVFWIEAISRISVTKALALGAFIPFLTLMLSCLIFKEVPTIWQIASLPFLIIGMLILTDNLKFKKLSKG